MMALPDKQAPTGSSKVFLPGTTTHGHHQIEIHCSICHLPDGGVTDQSCRRCHEPELKSVRDTHPAAKFRDPTKAHLLERIDARNCLSCHVEHQEEQTLSMGVTVAADFCFHCHQDVAVGRPSHQHLSFRTCATAGCHNYHDNTALYENFLYKHTREDRPPPAGRNPQRKFEQNRNAGIISHVRAGAADADAPESWRTETAIADWSTSAHARTGVNCSGCHREPGRKVGRERIPDSADLPAPSWNVSPTHEACRECHEGEVAGFLNGKHGMRLAAGLSAMTPDMARAPMHVSASHRVLNCSACHSPHTTDVRHAAHDACIQCHDDQHSRSYKSSVHFQRWQDELAGFTDSGTGVSCATCHMPRNTDGTVEHNQNLNLRPNEKMIRTVCMNCHELQFSLDALADPKLKANCYSSSPSIRVRSPEMATEWLNGGSRD